MDKYSSETEQKIYRAATQIFVEKGWDGARMVDIARAAGLNKALLHYYFRSKERLYQKIFVHEITTFFSTLTGSLDMDLPIQDFLREFIYKYIGGIEQNPKITRFMIWELGKGGTLIKPLLNDLFNGPMLSIPKAIINKISDAIENNQIRKVEPLQLMISLLGACLFPFIAQPILEEVFDGVQILDAAFLEQRKKEVFELFWNSIKI